MAGSTDGRDDYEERLRGEALQFAEREVVHDLPQIYHYWSNRYLLPKVQNLAVSDLHDLFAQPLRLAAEECAGPVRVASLGAGNCDFELQVLQRLSDELQDRVELHCFDLQQAMLERGRTAARELGLSAQVHFIEADANRIEFRESFQVVFANQCLHHFVELEHVFEAVRDALAPGGRFVTSDMIGRNGHMLWPEARQVVDRLWRLLPEKYKYNHALHRHEKVFEDWDCSTEGFEGIRAQEILELLVEHFHFELFAPFGSFLDVFIGRGFGPNFDSQDAFDLAFIDFAAQLEERLLREGSLTPTHLMAWMTKEPPAKTRHFEGPAPSACVREPENARQATAR